MVGEGEKRREEKVSDEGPWDKRKGGRAKQSGRGGHPGSRVGWGQAGEEEGPLSGPSSTWRTDLKRPRRETRVLGCALLPRRAPMGRRRDDVPLPTPDLPPLLPEKLPKFAL